MNLRLPVCLSVIPLALVALAGPSFAHTDSDLVAVPAGAAAEVTLEPTHGCGESPTIEVATRVPVRGATPDEVPGWTATATADSEGNTVLEWTGGSLPAHEVGAFPVAFTAPDTPGELLTFPFVQTCENGEELAWISGDPEAEFPAPRLLILPAGFEPAETLDDVPADAPGRDLLTAIADVDNPTEPTSTSVATTSSTASTTSTVARGEESDDGPPWAAIVVGIALGTGALVLALTRLRRR